MARRVRAILVSEDRQQEVFTRRVLLALGWETRQITVLTAPRGGGSGEQYVRRQFAAEVAKLRKAHVTGVLIGVVDADVGSVDERVRQFTAEIVALSSEALRSHERVALLVPRRNIETWIHALDNHDVDEETPYDKFVGNESKCATAAARFAKVVHAQDRIAGPPSLLRGVAELKRLLEE